MHGGQLRVVATDSTGCRERGDDSNGHGRGDSPSGLLERDFFASLLGLDMTADCEVGFVVAAMMCVVVE